METLIVIQYLVAFAALFIGVFLSLVYLKNFNRIPLEKELKSDWTPLVSILIPAYNEEAGIAKCIETVLAMDYPKDMLEVIVLDDGSTDRTAEIAKRYEGRGVKVISKPNTGKADSLNQGISMAKGELIATMDADSDVSPHTLRRMLAYFNHPQVAAVASAVKVREANNFIEEMQRIEYLFTLFSRKVVNFINAIQVTPGPFSIFKRKVLLEVGGFDTKSMVEDQEIALNLQKHGYKINSTTDSDVYTEIPHNFAELMRQRTRWQRGGFWNSVKYFHLISPEYGDFGMMILPFNIFGYFIVVFIAYLCIHNMLFGPIYGSEVGLGGLLLGLGPFQVLLAIGFLIGLLWYVYGLRIMFIGEKMSLFSILIYLILYPLITFIFWISAAYTEIKEGGRFTW